MRDFDQERRAREEQDRSFIIGGETFVRRASVRPEAIAEFDAIDTATKPADVLRIADDALLGMIEAEGHDRWRTLRQREEDAVNLGDILAVVEWLIEAQVERTPTQQPSPSTAGRGRTAAKSTDGSSSPAARKESAALTSVS